MYVQILHRTNVYSVKRAAIEDLSPLISELFCDSLSDTMIIDEFFDPKIVKLLCQYINGEFVTTDAMFDRVQRNEVFRIYELCNSLGIDFIKEAAISYLSSEFSDLTETKLYNPVESFDILENFVDWENASFLFSLPWERLC